MKKQLSIIALMLLLSFGLSFVSLAQDTAPAAQPATEKILSKSQAVVLGIVEGLTEYLPVSSTGHLLLAEKLMGIGESPDFSAARKEQIKEAADAYTICIQIGAILAVLWIYFGRIKQLGRGLLRQDADGRQLLINVLAGFVPAAVIGLLFNKLIKSYLFGPWPVVVAWLVGGIAILLVSLRNRRRAAQHLARFDLEAMSWKMALIIGFAQCIAMWPGVSRSLVTIVGGLLVGMSMQAAVEFSFLLGVVTLGAATAYDLLKHGELMLQTFDPLSLLIGIVVAFVAAVLSVKWMVSYLSRHGLELFGYYRVLIAVVTTLYLLTV